MSTPITISAGKDNKKQYIIQDKTNRPTNHQDVRFSDIVQGIPGKGLNWLSAARQQKCGKSSRVSELEVSLN
jgi:hypothetical protein